MVGLTGKNLSFLLSLPRSGSTLLSVMLDNHPAITAPVEPWIMLALDQLAHVDIRHPAHAQSVGKAVRDFTADGGDLVGIRAAAAALYGRAVETTGKSFFIDKTPRYYLILDTLAQVFPDARFVLLRRDPLDVAASYKNTWAISLPSLITTQADDSNLFDLVLGLDRLDRFAERMGERVYSLRYEDLVADPQGQLAAVLDFLGQEATPETLARLTDLSGLKRTEADFGDPKILKTTAPHTRSIGSWEREFTDAEQQALFDAIGRDRLERLGYGATVQRLLKRGLIDRGPETVAAIRAHAEKLLAGRYGDIERVTTAGYDLSPHAQERARFVVAGDEAWNGRYADRMVLDQTLAFIESERVEHASQHTLWQTELARRDLMVKERDEEIGNRGRHIARLDTALKEAEEDRERLRSALKAVQEQCDGLRSSLADRDARIAAMASSASWKMTAPLRALGDKVKKP